MIIVQLVSVGVCVGFGIAIGMATLFAVQQEFRRLGRHMKKKERK